MCVLGEYTLDDLSHENQTTITCMEAEPVMHKRLFPTQSSTTRVDKFVHLTTDVNISTQELLRLHFPDKKEFKSVYVALWVMNHFTPKNNFLFTQTKLC